MDKATVVWVPVGPSHSHMNHKRSHVQQPIEGLPVALTVTVERN